VAKFDPEVHDRLRRVASKEQVTCLVLFENQMFDSSEFGRRTAVMIGPPFTYKKLSDVEGGWLNDLPSQRQYPVAYWEKEEKNEKEETEPQGPGGPGSGD
jgi:hypothetical protein